MGPDFPALRDSIEDQHVPATAVRRRNSSCIGRNYVSAMLHQGVIDSFLSQKYAGFRIEMVDLHGGFLSMLRDIDSFIPLSQIA
jgi:hypothetical protein